MRYVVSAVLLESVLIWGATVAYGDGCVVYGTLEGAEAPQSAQLALIECFGDTQTLHLQRRKQTRGGVVSQATSRYTSRRLIGPYLECFTL